MSPTQRLEWAYVDGQTPAPPYVWACEMDEVHVTGTHDLAIARNHATQFARDELMLTDAEAEDWLADAPRLWWSCPTVTGDEDPWFRVVPPGTPGAVPITTWPL